MLMLGMGKTILSQRASQADRVYQTLMHDLRHGTWRPGGAISVKETAARLRVSPTPVREALERLVGTGMVSVSNDRNGFIMPRLGMRGFVSLTDTFGLLAEASVRACPSDPDAYQAITVDAGDPVGTTEALFGQVFRAGGNDVTAWVSSQLGNMLAPYRLVEPHVVPSWAAEMTTLRDALTGKRAGPAIRAYAKVRRAHAARLVDHVEQGS